MFKIAFCNVIQSRKSFDKGIMKDRCISDSEKFACGQSEYLNTKLMKGFVKDKLDKMNHTMISRALKNASYVICGHPYVVSGGKRQLSKFSSPLA